MGNVQVRPSGIWDVGAGAHVCVPPTPNEKIANGTRKTSKMFIHQFNQNSIRSACQRFVRICMHVSDFLTCLSHSLSANKCRVFFSWPLSHFLSLPLSLLVLIVIQTWKFNKVWWVMAIAQSSNLLHSQHTHTGSPCRHRVFVTWCWMQRELVENTLWLLSEKQTQTAAVWRKYLCEYAMSKRKSDEKNKCYAVLHYTGETTFSREAPHIILRVQTQLHHGSAYRGLSVFSEKCE